MEIKSTYTTVTVTKEAKTISIMKMMGWQVTPPFQHQFIKIDNEKNVIRVITDSRKGDKLEKKALKWLRRNEYEISVIVDEQGCFPITIVDTKKKKSIISRTQTNSLKKAMFEALYQISTKIK